jgi:2-oxoglutarate ferredoxin oxidoreductase subunit delta
MSCTARGVSYVALDMDSLTPKGYHPVMLTSDGCTGCGICAIICPEAALTVYREAPVKQSKIPAP